MLEGTATPGQVSGAGPKEAEMTRRIALLLLALQGGAGGAVEATCGGDFAAWVSQVREEAVGAGLAQAAIGLLDRVRPNPQVLSLDRSQKVFAQDWQTFAGRMVNPYRLRVGLQHLGWRAGELWLQEVRIPDELRWEQTGAYNRSPRYQWAAWGMRDGEGADLEPEGRAASLLLPMGRKRVAFLAYANFDVFLRWNQSLVYSTTAAYLATRLAGAPNARLGQPEPGLSGEQMQRLQQRLTELGYDVGAIDGILGAKTREAVRQEQLRLGLPADAWPTPALLAALRE